MKRLISLAAVTAITVISLTACSSGNTVVANSHVTIAEVGSISTLNPDVTSTEANKIASDLSALTSQNFYELDKNGELVANKNFGIVKVLKQSPFTVSYTFGKSAVWSDGSKLDSTDLALAVVAAKNKNFNSVHFGSSLRGATIVGQPNAGDNSITLEFDKPVADWKTVLDVAVPAHVVGKSAGIVGNVAAVRAGILDAIFSKKTAVLNSLASAYSAAFEPKSNIENFVSSGAYIFSSVAQDNLVLKAVRDYPGLHTAIAETVNVQFFEDNASAFKQVGAGKVDVFAPQATLNEPQADLVTQAQALNTKVATVEAPGSSITEQFVINLQHGTLADSSYRNEKIAPALRQAFLNIVPKARAVDFASMTQTVSRSDSFVYSTSSKNYSAVTSSNGSGNYILQDAEKASELIGSLKLGGRPNVRVLFDSDNPAAVAEWTLLSDNASTSGFRLTNISSSDPSSRLASGSYEVYLGELPLLGVGAGSVQQLVNGPARMPSGMYTELTKDVFSANEKSLSGALQALDKKLFDTGYGLPLYQLPNLLVYNNRVQGLISDPFGSNSTWGYWTWHVSADK